MKTLISTIFIAIAVSGHGQALREINYNYLYDPDAKFSFDLRPARVNDSWIIAYCLTSHDTAIRPDQLTIVWEGRDGLGEKESFPLNAVDER
ncbi:MAG TPA: hypothetical protein VEB86_14330, partial [Chryseosolibacter sp.]|nr:hypothetical protein [Chryseosolibacter sp.]